MNDQLLALTASMPCKQHKSRATGDSAVTYHETDSPNPQKQAERELVAKHIEAFLARGGKITEIPSGYQAVGANASMAFTITSEAKRREKAKKRLESIAEDEFE